MPRGVVIGAGVLLVAVVAAVVALPFLRPSEPRAYLPIHEAAANGQLVDSIQDLVKNGANVNARDTEGKTPLHHAAAGGHVQTTQTLLELGADPDLRDDSGQLAVDYATRNGHDETAGALRGAKTSAADAAHSRTAAADPRPQSRASPGLNPNLKYPTLAAYESAIDSRGVLLQSEHVWLFAPIAAEAAANTIFPYLVRAYDALFEIVGAHTNYTMVVYHFPPGHADAMGGTSECTIWYGYENLNLEQHEEWTQHGVPHVSGYIEEMAHNFVSGTKAQFGWEMVGWSIGVEATQRVANNPVFQRHVESTRRTQAETFARYTQSDHIFPADIEPNLCDRIHAHLLYMCEEEYGPKFWPDFFAAIRERKEALANAIELGEGDPARNERYRITIAAFDSLRGLNFIQRLRENGISTTIDIKSLHPTEDGWNRRFE